ncbi:MAG: MEKHLA domain-containing protein [Planctomycetes bacterium]|nr:MEKHLA domain-containing protein [Planctomycetota bacterium]
MSVFARPAEANSFLAEQIAILRHSLKLLSNQDLVHHELTDAEAARELFIAPFAIVSHNTEPDPIFNYANQTALDLFEMTWEDFTRLPSRKSAAPVNRADRSRLLQEVTANGISHNYSGVRLSQSGRTFLIEDGTVWNLQDSDGSTYGQAATFSRWTFL